MDFSNANVDKYFNDGVSSDSAFYIAGDNSSVAVFGSNSKNKIAYSVVSYVNPYDKIIDG